MQREADGSPRTYWRALIRRLFYALAVIAAALMPAAAGAEVLDELVVLTEQADAVIRVSFGLRIQYLRHEIFGDSLVDIYFRPLTLDGAPVKLTSLEFRVLSYLMHHRGRVISQIELIEHIYAQDFDRDSNTVEVFIARLRRKLGSSLIETVRGLGYRMGA